MSMIEIRDKEEKAILVGVEMKDSDIPVNVSLDELERLVDTAGPQVVGRVTQRIARINPKTYIGIGKAQEIADLVQETGANVVVFDDELSPSQQANLEKIVSKDCKIIDRTALILDIFALHASTKEGRLQVKLAQNKYLYPRLRGMWSHLASNRMGGGVGSRFGEGESQLEVDRRMVRNRIASISRELAHLENIRSIQRKKRLDDSIYKISIAGYTNAGKSSLINVLTHSMVKSEDQLFATLDPTTRKLTLPDGRIVTITDTIGFIRKLPTTLIESFKSTLDEINSSNCIIHLIDCSSDELDSQIKTVEEILEQIEANTIKRIQVFNKIDLIEDPVILTRLKNLYPDALFISTLTQEGIDELLEMINQIASASDELINVLIPFSEGDLLSFAHSHCHIINKSYVEEGIRISLYVSEQNKYRFKHVLLSEDS